MRSRAQAVIQLRGIELNGQWNPFVSRALDRMRGRRARHRTSIAPPDKRTGATAFSARCRLTEADLHPFELRYATATSGFGRPDWRERLRPSSH